MLAVVSRIIFTYCLLVINFFYNMSSSLAQKKKDVAVVKRGSLIRPIPCFNQKLTNSIVQEIYLTILVRKTIPDLHAVVITNGREHAFVNRTSALIWTRITSLLMEDIFSIPQYQVINE